MTFGGRTGGNARPGAGQCRDGSSGRGPRHTTTTAPGRTSFDGTSAAGGSQEKTYMTVNGIDVALAVAAAAVLFAAHHYREWATWNDKRKRARRRHIREWYMHQSRDTTLHDRIRPYRVEQAGDTFPSDWAQAA